MSRIGKLPINIPAGVQLTIADGMVTVRGPKGVLEQKLHPHVTVVLNDNVASVTVADATETRDHALWGLFQRLINNMVIGVTTGFSKQLELNGVGFKVPQLPVPTIYLKK